MGNDSLKPSIAHNENFALVKEMEHHLFGKLKVYSDGKQAYSLRTYTMLPEQARTLLERIRKCQVYNHPQIITISKIETEIEDAFCSHYQRVFVTSEFTDQTVEHVTNYIQFIENIVQGLIFLDYRGIDTCQLNSQRIFVFTTGYKLSEPIQEASDFERLFLGEVEESEFIAAPEVLQCLREGRSHFNNQKATTFNLGLILLSLLSKVSYQPIYRPEHFLLVDDCFHEYINLIDSLEIGQNIKTIIHGCLRLNPNQRPSYKEILDMLHTTEVTISESPSPKKLEQRCTTPVQQMSFNPALQETNRMRTESSNLNQERPSTVIKSDVKVEQKPIKKIYNLENLENTYVNKRASATSNSRPVSNLRWK